MRIALQITISSLAADIAHVIAETSERHAAMTFEQRGPRIVVCGSYAFMAAQWPAVNPFPDALLTVIAADAVHSPSGQNPGTLGADALICLPKSLMRLNDAACRSLDCADIVVCLNQSDMMPTLVGAAMRYTRRMHLPMVWLQPHVCASNCSCGAIDATCSGTLADMDALTTLVQERSYWAPTEHEAMLHALSIVQTLGFQMSPWSSIAEQCFQHQGIPWFVALRWAASCSEKYEQGVRPPSTFTQVEGQFSPDDLLGSSLLHVQIGTHPIESGAYLGAQLHI